MTIWHLLKERTMSSSGVWSRNSAKQKKIFGPRSRICEVGVLRSVNLHEAQAGCQWEDVHRKALGKGQPFRALIRTTRLRQAYGAGNSSTLSSRSLRGILVNANA